MTQHGHDDDGHDHDGDDHDHDHDGHDRGRGRAHAHSHAGHSHGVLPASLGTAFAVGAALNLGFVVVEATYGVLANSMALLSDAGHNLSDVLSLLLAWGASALAQRQPSRRYTYGLRSSSILAALLNAVVLLLAVGAIAWGAVQRLLAPEPVAAGSVMAVAAAGILVNGATALLFRRGSDDDLNVRGAYLHMLADAAISLGVVATGALVMLTGWVALDPIVSLAVVAVIVWGTWDLLRQAVDLAMQAVPPGIDPERVRSFLESQAGVARIHDLHIWPMSTTETALTTHLVMPAGCSSDEFLAQVTEGLKRDFGIAHATLQVERGDGRVCPLEPDNVV